MASERPELERVDLHGCRPEEALARLGRALHRARVRRETEIQVITGRGLGNPTWTPVLRNLVEAWLSGPDGARHGVRGFEREAHGGALRVRLARTRPAPDVDEQEPERGRGLEDLGPADLGLDDWDPADELG